MILHRPVSSLRAIATLPVVFLPVLLLGVLPSCSSSGDSGAEQSSVEQTDPPGSETTDNTSGNPTVTGSEASMEDPTPSPSAPAMTPANTPTRPVPPVTSDAPSASEQPSEDVPATEPEPASDGEDDSSSANGGNGNSDDSGNSEDGEAGASTSDGGGGGETVVAPGACVLEWPEATSEESLSETFNVDVSFDGEFRRFSGSGALGTSGQDENQGALFRLADGAILENVIIANPAADGIHCDGSCTLRNVWWEDVGEDAATLDGDDDSQVMTVECSGARGAEDKVFQHNGPGTFIIREVVVEDFNRLYRSCGNCETQFTRHVVVEDVTARGGNSLVGINENYSDTAEFSAITVYGSEDDTTICALYEGNDTGAEPTSLGSGPDGDHCLYDDSDISWE